MDTIQVRTEIHKVVDAMPDDILQDVLNYFTLVQRQTGDQRKFNNNLKKILTEDRELFERLAK